MIGRPKVFEPVHALTAYWRAVRCRDEAQLAALANRRLDHWLRHSVPRVPYYAGRQIRRLDDLPIIDKETVMADFAAFNRAGITAEAGWDAFAGDKMIGPYIVGASTGTSGNRGLFVVSQQERFRWLGTILAKALPGFWRRPHRVAVLLPLNTPLYDSANRLSRLKLRFFDIGEDYFDDLCAFAPSVVIAPPKILRALAEAKAPIDPSHVFSGAEVLDDLDRAIIERHFPAPLGQIYMATEGLMAVSCAHGNLHLCEDTMHFELPQAGADPDLRAVIISDFSRDVQIMARYRMNDLIRLGPPCPCGLPHRTVAAVVGRADDCFDLPGGLVTPDILRNAVVDADRRITDFRVLQTGAEQVEVVVPEGVDLAAVERAFAALFERKGIAADVAVKSGPLAPQAGCKLRRVENRYRPG
ncbi:CoF synthetase [Yoonia sp. BS5-3]|uniref:CoF synthetase n=1 Tax=Yoonia phaeophyticola TaxID=3137369 RepID=A0ABZ2V1K7_9RHOB